jgi:hypothetical protein
MAASISRYYDSRSEDETREEQLWGQFSESQFPLDKNMRDRGCSAFRCRLPSEMTYN